MWSKYSEPYQVLIHDLDRKREYWKMEQETLCEHCGLHRAVTVNLPYKITRTEP